MGNTATNGARGESDRPDVAWRSGAWRVGHGDLVADVRWRIRGGLGPFASFGRGDTVDLDDPRPPARSRVPDHRGRLTALRSPVETKPPTPPPGLSVEVPGPVGEPSGISWSGLLPAAVSAGVAALVFTPVFAMLGVASAVVLLGRWAAGHFGARRNRRARNIALARAAVEREEAVATWIDSERRRRDRFDPETIWRWCREQRTPWHARLSGELTLTVGRGRMPIEVPLVAADGRSDHAIALAPSMPVDVALAPGRGLAVVGDRASVLDAARWLVASVGATHGPADIGVVLLTTVDRIDQWDWVKWLPSLSAVALDPAEIERAIDQFEAAAGGAEGGPASLVIVDGPEPTGPSGLARLLAGSIGAARVLWLGDTTGVPAGCGHRLTIRPDSRFVLDDLVLAGDALDGDAFVFDRRRSAAVGRWLAPFEDPELVVVDGRLPVSMPLAELVGLTAGQVEPVVDRVRPAADRSHLRVPLGRGERGDRWLDLVADGPHGLVAGTTGSGKSELLRTLVAGLCLHQSPDLVTFVLVDFKGGGAFDLVADLPHVAAVVTDLDAVEAERALLGLRAELVDRERRLRAAEVSDLADLPPDHPSGFPRLVVVVDEFAALAAELPLFLDGLVDIARRGRSLGVHLVLATQRPAGVVTGEIRANANLRICLRVQDRADSVDVIDGSQAADLPPIPGRALVRTGSDLPEVVQVAHLSATIEPVEVEPFVVHPRLLDVTAGEPNSAAARVCRALRAAVVPLEPASAPADVLALVESLDREAVAPVPWLPPLPDVRWTDLRAGSNGQSTDGAAVLGLLDDPEHRARRQLAWRWRCEGLLIVGTDRSEVERTVAAAVCGALVSAIDHDSPAPSVVVLDGAAGSSPADALSGLAGLPAVGEVIPIVEIERTVRLLRRLSAASGERGGVCTAPSSTLLVVNGWSSVCAALETELGASGPTLLARLVAAVGGGLGVVVTGSSDRDVPSRIAAALSTRVVHRLADPAGYLTYGLRPREVPDLGPGRVVVPGCGLVGAVAVVEPDDIGALAVELDRSEPDRQWPTPTRILPDRVEREELPAPLHSGRTYSVAIGLDLDLDAHRVSIGPKRPLVVLGQPGSGRSTVLRTIRAGLPSDASVVFIDDADDRSEAEVAEDLERGRTNGLVIASTIHATRAFGGWIGPLLTQAQVVFLTPHRTEGEVCRVSLPDLSSGPRGRAAVVDRGRVAVVQVAA